MIKSAIEKILSLAPDTIIDGEGGRKYWAVSRQGLCPPRMTSLCEVKSLDAFMSIFDSRDILGTTSEDDIQIVVSDERNVSLVSYADGIWRKRDEYITARYCGESFPFGQYLEIEEAIIKMMCLFVDSERKSLLIAHLSSICSEEIVTSLDDGISQAVTVEKRTGRKDRATIDPIIELAPYRTFTEVEQPTSHFLLRMKNVNKDRPFVALFEADGGAWRVGACRNVAQYLRNKLENRKLNIPVIG
jgi:hypothetical protein